MAYSDKNYFLTKIKLSELNILIADDNGDPKDERLSSAIEEADDIINNYLRKASRSVPIHPVPKSIRLYSYYISLYTLHENVQPEDIPERVRFNFEYSIDALKAIGAGKADIEEIEQEDATAHVFAEHQEVVMGKNIF